MNRFNIFSLKFDETVLRVHYDNYGEFNGDLYNYWFKKDKIIAKYIQICNCTLVSEASIERLFSQFSIIVTKYRRSMKVSTLDMYIEVK